MSEGTLAGAKILVVEDNDDLRFLMCRYLKEAGAVIAEAADGMKALQLIRSSSYDVVFMDIRLPDISGIEVLKAMRDEDIQTPAIAVSAHGKTVFGSELVESGFCEFLSKPVSKQQAVSAAETILKQASSSQK